MSRRLALRTAALAAGLTLRRLDPLVHVSPEELGITTTAGSSRVSTLLWLTRGLAADRAPMDTVSAVDALQAMQATHDRAFGVPDALAADAHRWRDVLARGLREVRCLRVVAPPGPLPSDVAYPNDAVAG